MRPEVIKRKTLESLSKADRYDILKDYSKGVKVSEIAKRYQMDPQLVQKFIDSEVNQMVAMKETQALIKAPYQVKHKNPKDINKKFLGKLSDPNGPLTDEEQLYVYLYTESGGDNSYALEGSSLTDGLPTSNPKVASDLRGQYLRSKPNVAKALREYRIDFIKNFGVNKEDLQSHLIELLVNLKQKGNAPSQLLKTIELLMKSEDLLNTNIKLSEVNPEEEMRKLFETIKTEDGTYEPRDT